jgi:hypothetical protein
MQPVTSADIERTATNKLRQEQAAARQKELQAKARSEAESAEAKRQREEADQRYQKYRDAMDAAKDCRSDCAGKYRTAADELELAQKRATTAYCAQESSGIGGGACGGPRGCAVCSDALGMRKHYDELTLSTRAYGVLMTALPAVNRSLLDLGRDLKLQTPATLQFRIDRYTLHPK